MLIRHDHQRVPPMVDCTITDFGMTLARALMPLCAWGIEHRDQIGEVARGSPPERAGPPSPTAT